MPNGRGLPARPRPRGQAPENRRGPEKEHRDQNQARRTAPRRTPRRGPGAVPGQGRRGDLAGRHHPAGRGVQGPVLPVLRVQGRPGARAAGAVLRRGRRAYGRGRGDRWPRTARRTGRPGWTPASGPASSATGSCTTCTRSCSTTRTRPGQIRPSPPWSSGTCSRPGWPRALWTCPTRNRPPCSATPACTPSTYAVTADLTTPGSSGPRSSWCAARPACPSATAPHGWPSATRRRHVLCQAPKPCEKARGACIHGGQDGRSLPFWFRTRDNRATDRNDCG